MPFRNHRTTTNASEAISLTSYLINVSGGTYVASDVAGTFRSSSTSFDAVYAAVMSDIGSDRAVITLGAGVFVTAAGLTVAKSNVDIRGQGQGVTVVQADTGSGMDSVAILGAEPSQSAAIHSLTSDAVRGDLIIYVSPANAATYAVDDFVSLSSSLSIDSENSGRTQGEIHRIVAVNAGTGAITLGIDGVGGTQVYETMTVANSAKLQKLTMYENLSVSGITFTDPAASRPNTLTVGQVYFRFCYNVTVLDCQFDHMYSSGVMFYQCWNYRTVDCAYRDIKDVTPSSNTYYGVQIRGASLNGTIVGNSFHNMRHAVTTGAGGSGRFAGTCRNITMAGNASSGTFTAHYDCHQGAKGVTITGNTMIGDDSAANGIQTRSPAIITGNAIEGVSGKGISVFGGGEGSTITGNEIIGATDGINISTPVNRVLISDNTIKGGTRGITLARTTATVTITNASPFVVTKSSHGFVAGSRVSFTTSGALPTGISAGTEYFVIAEGITTGTFEISATENGAAVNTSGSQSGTHTMAARGGSESLITGNSITDNSSYGINADGQRNVKVSDNYFRNNSRPINLADTDGLASDWSIKDNKSHAHTTSDLPTLGGVNHVLVGNDGFGAMTVPFAQFSSGPQTLTLAHHVVECTSGTFTINLPTAVGCPGREYRVRNSGAGTITVDPAGSETVDGAATATLAASAKATYVSNGTNWITA